MGVPIMLRADDDERIEKLKRQTGAKTKVQVIRDALDLLEKEADRAAKVRRWAAAVQKAGQSGLAVNAEFRPHSRLKRVR